MTDKALSKVLGPGELINLDIDELVGFYTEEHLDDFFFNNGGQLYKISVGTLLSFFKERKVHISVPVDYKASWYIFLSFFEGINIHTKNVVVNLFNVILSTNLISHTFLPHVITFCLRLFLYMIAYGSFE